jgi:hypothetical protein
MSEHISSLRIANEAFLVSSLIDRCPKTMMLRELVVNAIEAARTAPQAGSRIVISAREIGGIPKLCIWNTGLGMSSDELYRVCDLASSLHKVNSLDQNFGMGAKVASLPSNKHGVRYRSCKNASVSEVVLCYRNGTYGRLRRAVDVGGDLSEVHDVTAACQTEGYDISLDWTEVVLFGNTADQNTFTNPYGGNPLVGQHWLPDLLTHRFFRITGGLSIDVLPQPDSTSVANQFVPLWDRRTKYARAETVITPSGLNVHFLYAVEAVVFTSDTDQYPAVSGLVGLVYKDEIYAIRDDRDWLLESPAYGFPFAAKHFAVFIELPENYPVRPEAYRQFLRYRGGDQRQVLAQDFASLVRQSIPEWLSKIIDSYGPTKVDWLDDMDSELRNLLSSLGLYSEDAILSLRDTIDLVAKKVEKETAELDVELVGTDKKPRSRKATLTPPEIIHLTDDTMLEERGLVGQAARYYPAPHQLFINLQYSSINLLRRRLQEEFANSLDSLGVKLLAKRMAEQMITRQLAKSVIYTISKKKANWSPQQIGIVQSPEALTLIADNIELMVEPLRQQMAKHLGIG